MLNSSCFNSTLLKEYLLGKLPAEQSDAIAVHLEACLTCEATVSQLDRVSDTLTNGLRLPLAMPPEDSKAVAELQVVLAQIPAADLRDELLPAAESMSGSTVLRDYRLLETLGSGGMGTVYKAVHTRLDRLVAVKLLPSRRLGDSQAVSRFQREMRVIGQLSHPAIVQATDAGEVDGTHFLVMEYVDGFDLNHVAKVCGILSTPDACEIIRQAALGLEYAHRQGIIHRDIKPSNLMLARVEGTDRSSGSFSPLAPHPSPLIKILDLGLALLSGEQAPVDELTTVGQLMGTLDYMAPEQLEDSHQVGPQADVYALAATLHRLLTGLAPFAKEDRKTPLQKLRALATQTVPPVRERRADLPVALAEIIDRALRRESNERFASMSEFAAAIAPWCCGHDLSKLVQGVAATRPINLPAVTSGTPKDNVATLARAGVEPPASPRSGERDYETRESSPKPPRRPIWASVLAAIVALIALGVIVLETGKGRIVIESAQNVEVRIKRSGKVVEQFEVATGSKGTRVSAGEYEIELVGASDKLQIEQNRVTLQRGGQVVVKVSEIDKTAVAVLDKSPSLGMPDESDAGRIHHGEMLDELPEFLVDQAENKKLDDPVPVKPFEIVDRAAKGMETFEAFNPDVADERKVRAALQKKIDAEFKDLALVDVLKKYSEQTGVEFIVDVQALTEAGPNINLPVRQSLKGVAAAVCLDFLLRPLKLDWEVDGGQVIVTTSAKAKSHFVNRAYAIGKLLPGIKRAIERERANPPKAHPGGFGGGFGGGGGGGGFFSVGIAGLAPSLLSQGGGFGGGGQPEPAFIPDEAWHLASLLEQTISHTWQATKGEGGSVELLHNVLLVRQTQRAQADIEALLRTIEAAFLKPLTKPTEVRHTDYPSDEDARTRKQLAQKLEIVELNNVPLSEVATWLRDKLGVPVLLMEYQLSEESIPMVTPITLTLKNVSGELLLKRMLQPLNLAWNIEQGVLVITTAKDHVERRITKVYDVRELIARGLHPDRLVGGLQTMTQGPWQNRDGEGGNAMTFADTLMIVQQTEMNHTQVEKFLASLWLQMSDEPVKPIPGEPTKPAVPVAQQPPKGRPTPKAAPNLTPPKSEAIPAAEPKPTQPAVSSNGLYEGGTFDYWLDVISYERSPAQLVVAFEALRLLAKPEQSRLVAERLLQVFRNVDGESYVGSGNDRKQAWVIASDLISSISADVMSAVAANELVQGNTRSRMHVLQHVIRPTPEWRSDPRFQEAMLQTCLDQDASIRMATLQWLAMFIEQIPTADINVPAKRALRIALSDKVETVALVAARGLVDSDEDKDAVAEVLARVVTQSESEALQTEALRLIAVMGANASKAVAAVIPLLLEEGSADEERAARSSLLPPGARVFSNIRRGGSSGNNFSRRELAIMALARMGKAAESAMPTIEKELSLPNHKSKQTGSLEVIASFGDRLVAAKARIQGIAIPDAKFFATKVKVTVGDLALLESVYKSVRSENELLRQHYGDKHAKVRELDAQMKTMRDDYNRARNGTVNGDDRLPGFKDFEKP